MELRQLKNKKVNGWWTRCLAGFAFLFDAVAAFHLFVFERLPETKEDVLRMFVCLFVANAVALGTALTEGLTDEITDTDL